MSDIIKKDVVFNWDKLSRYISLTGFGPITLYNLLLNENSNISDISEKFSLNQFELDDYLDILQAVKLLQVIYINNKISYQILSPIALPENNKSKQDLIKDYKPSLIDGNNISKTYNDVFVSSDKTRFNFDISWSQFYEEIFNEKINAFALMQINQIQEKSQLIDEVMNVALLRTKKICSNFNIKYFEKCVKTFIKLKIKNKESAQKFFKGVLFFGEKDEQDYLEQLENELKNMER